MFLANVYVAIVIIFINIDTLTCKNVNFNTQSLDKNFKLKNNLNYFIFEVIFQNLWITQNE